MGAMIEYFDAEEVKRLAAFCAGPPAVVFARRVHRYAHITAISADGAMAIYHRRGQDVDAALLEGERLANLLSDTLMATMIAEGAWQP